MSVPNPDGNTVSWGLRDLDATVGQLLCGRFYLILARPGNGKTLFGMNWLNKHVERLARAFKSGDPDIWHTPRKVQVFLTERTPEVAVKAWAAMRAGLDEDSVMMGEWDIMPDGSYERWRKELTYLSQFGQDGYVSLENLTRPTATTLRQRIDEYDPDIILFDHAQRLKADGRQSKFDAIAEGAHLFQEAATKGNRIVIVMSQVSRTGDKMFSRYRPPSDEDAKYAGELEENADVVLGLFRPLKKMTRDQEREIRNGGDISPWLVPDMMGINIPKHRWRGKALDSMIFARCRDGRIEDREYIPF